MERKRKFRTRQSKTVSGRLTEAYLDGRCACQTLSCVIVHQFFYRFAIFFFYIHPDADRKYPFLLPFVFHGTAEAGDAVQIYVRVFVFRSYTTNYRAKRPGGRVCMGGVGGLIQRRRRYQNKRDCRGTVAHGFGGKTSETTGTKHVQRRGEGRRRRRRCQVAM